MFSGTALEQLDECFRSEDDCKQYLFDLKWKNGYRCRRCGCTKYYKGRTRFHLRCSSCSYDESVTAHTIFHKLKIPLLKVFGIAFRLSVTKKGMSTRELAREFSINQKSSWLFKRKTQEAMKTGEGHASYHDPGLVDLLIGGRKGRRGRKVRKGRLNPAIAREIELENMGILPFSGREKQFGEQVFEMSQGPPRGGKKVSGMNVVAMNLKGWLRGIHHHCSERFVHGYLDEFFFRFNGRHSMRSLWHRLIEQYMTKPPYLYKARAA